MRNNLKKKTNKKGFTLVELVMVVALIAILAAIAVPTVSSVIDTANENVDKANAQTIELALKTADAEIKAKIAPSGVTADTKVDDILATYKAGIKASDQGKSGKYFRYKDGKVLLGGTEGTQFDSDTKISDFLP